MATQTQTLSGRAVSEPRFFTTRYGQPGVVFDFAIDRMNHRGSVSYNLNATQEDSERVSDYYQVFAFGDLAQQLNSLGLERKIRITGKVQDQSRTYCKGGKTLTVVERRLTLQRLSRSGLDQR